MKKSLHLATLILIIYTTCINAQTHTIINSNKELKAFKHLDVAITAGTTGLGIDLATPLNKHMRLRGGFTFVPKFEYDMDFNITVGETAENKYDPDGNRIETKFEKLAGLLKEFTGTEINEEFNMIGEPSFSNVKLLLDVFPFKNKQWHFTTGFYFGPSEIGNAYNTTEDMPTLFAAGMYNKMYEKAANDEPVMVWNDYAIYMPKLLDYGRMGANIGKRDDGTLYKLEPDEDSMVKAKMKANSFRPYIGFGYGNSMMNNDNKYNVSFDCGLLFWGGVPDVITHDGTNLTKGFKEVYGKVGRYVDIVEKFEIFPVVNLRIAYRIF